MNKTVRLTFQKGDFLAIIFVVLLAAGLVFTYLPKKNNTDQAMVQIYQDGTLVKEASLDSSKEQIISISGAYTNEITIRDGKAAITTSDCPGTDCVYTGWISQPGRSIVCLPNRVEVRITGTSDVDFVVR